MTRWPIVRGALAAGLAAISATVAHAGPAKLSDPRWLAVAAAGAAAVATALTLAGARTLRTAEALRLLRQGTHAPAPAGAFEPVPFSVLAAAMLACQGGAHVCLMLGGAHPGTGAGGALALHAALALAGAVALHTVELVVARLTTTLEFAIRAAIAALEVVRPAPPAPFVDQLRSCRIPAATRGRGPPLAA